MLLCHKDHIITFVNTHHNHARLQQFTDLAVFHSQIPEFHFASITDGVPEDHQSLNDFAAQISPNCRSVVATEFRELFFSFLEKTSKLEPPSCIIADGMMSTIAMGVAEEFHVPLITFRTYSAKHMGHDSHKQTNSGGSIFCSASSLKNAEDKDKLLTSIPGLEKLLRDRDLPSVFRLEQGSFFLDFYVKETLAMTRASTLIPNTFDQLEAPIITKLATIFPKVYTIGPLHTLFKIQVSNNTSLSNKDGHLRKEDRSCITWFDHQKPKSVLCVSVGTVVNLSHEQLLEFWHGLVNSMKVSLC